MNSDLFGQQENGDVQAELTDNNFLDHVESQSDEAVSERDYELNAMIKSVNHKQHTLVNIAHIGQRTR